MSLIHHHGIGSIIEVCYSIKLYFLKDDTINIINFYDICQVFLSYYVKISVSTQNKWQENLSLRYIFAETISPCNEEYGCVAKPVLSVSKEDVPRKDIPGLLF